MKPRDRVAFSAIIDRPKLTLPDGLRLVVWPIINLEEWEIERPMARQVLPGPTGVPLLPDVPNWSWHEYGMRVGVWRFFAAFDRIAARGTLSINAKVVESYPRVAEAAKERGWEFMGHSYVQGPIHKLEDQRAVIHQSLDLLERFTGKRPVGWLGPGLTQTYETPELLAEAGVQYIGDWVYDDEPTEIATAKGKLVTLPYTVELNDIPMMIVQHHRADELLHRAKDQFDRLRREGAERAKILSIAIHPYISGVPHRIGYLEAFLDYARSHDDVAFWTGEEILAWWRRARPAH
ncbi:MAG TPA: polysaccharide deacetylase family protein [Stellaceae bacterium]|nr:polysaccharide deacetylase family protein [Stellaceae bacterium]